MKYTEQMFTAEQNRLAAWQGNAPVGTFSTPITPEQSEEVMTEHTPVSVPLHQTFAERVKMEADRKGITMNTLSIMLVGQADELDRYSGAVAHLSTQKQIAQRTRDAAKLREIAARYARRDYGD